MAIDEDGELVVTLLPCQRLGCEKIATWETWTLFTYNYFCDDHRRPDEEITDGWEQRHRPEGVLDSGGTHAYREH